VDAAHTSKSEHQRKCCAIANTGVFGGFHEVQMTQAEAEMVEEHKMSRARGMVLVFSQSIL
jgi:hypothetical protein